MTLSNPEYFFTWTTMGNILLYLFYGWSSACIIQALLNLIIKLRTQVTTRTNPCSICSCLLGCCSSVDAAFNPLSMTKLTVDRRLTALEVQMAEKETFSSSHALTQGVVQMDLQNILARLSRVEANHNSNLYPSLHMNDPQAPPLRSFSQSPLNRRVRFSPIFPHLTNISRSLRTSLNDVHTGEETEQPESMPLLMNPPPPLTTANHSNCDPYDTCLACNQSFD